MTKAISRKRVSTSLSNSSQKPPKTTTRRRYTNITSTIMQPSTSSKNVFESLNSDEDTSDMESIVTVTSKNGKRRKVNKTAKKNSAAVPKSSQKPPPLNIVGVEYAQVSELLDKVRTKVDDYSLSLAPFGIRVYSANTDRYNVLKNELKSAQLKFFTYQLRDEQMTKIVLHGLFHMSEQELRFHLEHEGIKPVKIKIMNIHQKRYSDHALYLLYFLKSDQIKISTLRETSAICHIKVRWQYYQNKRNGPMQCSRCMQYGHGGENCFLDPVCIRCGDSHFSRDCRLLIDPATSMPRDRIPDNMLKCGLCNQNHSANFSGCEKRAEFIQRQQRFRNRTQRRPRPTNAFVHAPQLDNFNFPALDPRARANNHEQIPLNRPTAADATMNNNDLFTASEIMSIFEELMSAINQATTKMEQITALGRIAIKYSNLR